MADLGPISEVLNKEAKYWKSTGHIAQTWIDRPQTPPEPIPLPYPPVGYDGPLFNHDAPFDPTRYWWDGTKWNPTLWRPVLWRFWIVVGLGIMMGCIIMRLLGAI